MIKRLLHSLAAILVDFKCESKHVYSLISRRQTPKPFIFRYNTPHRCFHISEKKSRGTDEKVVSEGCHFGKCHMMSYSVFHPYPLQKTKLINNKKKKEKIEKPTGLVIPCHVSMRTSNILYTEHKMSTFLPQMAF